jgi:hypothetical protein
VRVAALMANGGTTTDGDTGDEETQKRPRRLGLDLNELPPTRELIDFYRTKIGIFKHNFIKRTGINQIS